MEVAVATLPWGGCGRGRRITLGGGEARVGRLIGEGGSHVDGLLEAEVVSEEAPHGLHTGDGGAAALKEADQPR